MDLVATIYPGNVHTVLNLQAGEGGGGAGGGGARRAPPPAASERGDDARRPCEVGAFDPRSAAAAAWRQRYVRTRIEVGDNQIQIGMGDKSKWATTRFESKLKQKIQKHKNRVQKRGNLHEGGAKHLSIFLI